MWRAFQASEFKNLFQCHSRFIVLNLSSDSMLLLYFFSSGRCSRVNYAIKNPKFHFIQMPNLLTIHLSETHVYYLLQNDCRSAQLLACISWTGAETLMSVPEGICWCSSLRHCIKFHPSLGICLKQRVHPRSFSSKINVHFCFEGPCMGGGIFLEQTPTPTRGRVAMSPTD